MKVLVVVIFQIITGLNSALANNNTVWDSNYSKNGWKKTDKYYECKGRNLGSTDNSSYYLLVRQVLTPANSIGYYSYELGSDIFPNEEVFDSDMPGQIEQRDGYLILNKTSQSNIALTKARVRFLVPAHNTTTGYYASSYWVDLNCTGHGISFPAQGPF